MASLLVFLRDVLKAQIILSTANSTIWLDGVIAWLVFDLKDRPVNVFNITMLDETNQLLAELKKLITSGRAKLLIVASGKENSFIAGADVSAIFPETDQKKITQDAQHGQAGFTELSKLSIPTIAAINGACLGAGLELSLALQYRVASDSSKTQIGLPEVKLGLLPGAGGTRRLPFTIGLQQALPIILAGGHVDAKKALKIGIIDALFPHEDLLPGQHLFYSNVRNFALSKMDAKRRVKMYTPQSLQDKFLENTGLGRYLIGRQAAQGLDKQVKGRMPAPYIALDTVLSGVSLPFEDALALEASNFGRLAVTPDSKALISLFFSFEEIKKIDRFVNVKPLPVQQIAVLGAGVMGWQIANLFVGKKIPVYMRDVKQEIVSNGIRNINNLCLAKVKKGRWKEERAHSIMRLVNGGTDIAPLKDARFIVEAAVEVLELKQRILAEVEETCDEKTIFATNTSSICISQIATYAKRPENVVGFHFFNPISKMPLVEIIRGERTSDEAVATAYSMALRVGKIPIICKSAPGFIVNRILGIYMNEAGRLAVEGHDITLVDEIISEMLPMGPYRLLDVVGLDVAAHVGPILHKGLGSRFEQLPGFSESLAKAPQFLGEKSGAGWYTYKDGKQGPPNDQILKLVKKMTPKDAKICSRKDIFDRCILLQVNEAAYILADGVVDNADSLDLACVTGTGFGTVAKPFTPGPLAYADARGIHNVVQSLQSLESKYGERFHPAPLLLKMAANGNRFHPHRPDPKLLLPIEHLPYSKL